MQRCVIDEYMYEEWEFDTEAEMLAAAYKEALVCGDSLNQEGPICTIWNYHQQGVRWKGRVTQQQVEVFVGPRMAQKEGAT